MKKYLIALAGVFALGTAALTTQASAASYKVEKGDTLWSISQDEEVSVKDLKKLNNLSSDIIVPKQKLNTGKNEEKSYKIKKGDTLYKIATEKGVSVGDLKAINGLAGDTIYVGQTLALTGDKAKVEAASTQQVEPKAANPVATAPAKPAAQQQPATQPSSGKTMTVTATAYTPNCAGCSGVTATGVNVKANPHMKLIAVDPSVIPLGSKVWVEGYGTAIAADTGGAIKGHKIDLLMPNNSQANSWGVRTVTIKVLN